MELRCSVIHAVLLPLFFALGLVGTILSQPQNALDCDGVDDLVTIPNASALIANSTAMSLVCWVYPRNNAQAYPDFDGFAGMRNETDADLYLLQVSSPECTSCAFL